MSDILRLREIRWWDSRKYSSALYGTLLLYSGKSLVVADANRVRSLDLEGGDKILTEISTHVISAGIMMGNLGVQGRSGNTLLRHTMGRHGPGDRSNRGESFIDVCNFHLVVTARVPGLPQAQLGFG